MHKIGKIDDRVLDYLPNKGVKSDDIRLIVRADMNDEGIYCDNYIAVTNTELLLLAVRFSIDNPNPKKKRKELLSTLTEVGFERYNLSDIAMLSIDEMISRIRLVAKLKDESYVSLTYSTNSQKSDLYKFTKYFKQLTENGEIKIDDDEKQEDSEENCPKCGAKYPNPRSKICPNCVNRMGVLKRMGSFVLKYKVSVFLVIVTLIASAAISVLSINIGSKFFYDEVLSDKGKYFGKIFFVLSLIVITRLSAVLVAMFGSIVTSAVSARTVYDLKKMIFQSIERLSISYFMNKTTGALMNQVNSDANTIYWFFCDFLPYVLVYALQIIVIIILMVSINPILAILSLVTLPIAIVMIKFMFDIMKNLHSKRYTRQRIMRSQLSDVLSGVRVVKAFAKEEEETVRFGKATEELARASEITGVYAGVGFPIINLVIYLSSLIVWGVGGYMVMRNTGNMTYGNLMAFIAYVGIIYGNVYFLVDTVQMGADCFNAMSRLFEVMDAQPDVVEAKNPVSMERMKGDITFKNVEFSYVKGRKVIDGISFSIKSGETIGIVGHTGAGKSTLANLLIRLYDVEEGAIEIDGVNIKNIKISDIRKNVAMVSQETYLFAGTILDNIRYAKPDATYEEVIAASKAAGAHDFIVKLPDGYFTKVGSGYKDLSGGERQRVSIARALLHNPKILILDEATAAMDTQTERKIQMALEKLVEGRTTIMIAHRLSTLRDADYLIVIENGKMPEYGTHEELLNKNGIYARLYNLQLEALKNIGIEG